MKQYWYISAFCLLLACGADQKKTESNIIPRDKFVPLLIRMHILDAEITFGQALNPDLISKDYSRYDALLKQYGTDSTALARTFDHYSTRQQELIDIYTEVKDSLVTMAKKTVKPK